MTLQLRFLMNPTFILIKVFNKNRFTIFDNPASQAFTDLERDTPANGFGFKNLNFVTPETQTSTHYFWSNAYQVVGKPVDPAMTELSFQQIFQAFHQDWEVFDLQEENWDARPVIDTNQDAGAIAARAMMDRDIAAEQAAMGQSVAAE